MGKISIKKGDIVLFKFPFSDVNKYRKRPCVVLSNPDDEGDIILARISKTKSSNNFIELNKHFFDFISYIKFNKIFTVNENKLAEKIGELSNKEYDLLTSRIIEYMK